MKTGFVFVMLLLGFTACIPQTNTVNRVIIINAPAEDRVANAAPLLHDTIANSYPNQQYELISKSQASFAEGHADLFGSQALPNASAIANRLGAEIAVLVGAPIFERNVKIAGSGVEERRKISTRVQLELQILDPLTQTILSSYKSSLFTTYRVEPTTVPIIDIDKDQDMQDSVASAIKDLNPALAKDLDYIFQQLSPVSSSSQ